MKNLYSYRYIFICYLILLVCSCQEAPNTESFVTKTNVLLTIDASKDTKISSEKLFDSVKFIPLETKNESLIGKIDKMLVTTNYYVILSKTINTLFFFEKSGKYSHKINSATLSLSKLKILDFDVVRDEVIIYNIISSIKSLIVCNLKGELRKPITFDKTFIYFKIIGNSHYYYSAYLVDENNNHSKEAFSLVKYNSSDTLPEKYFPFDPDKIQHYKAYISVAAFFQSKNTTFFSRPYFYEFYKISETGVFEKYTVSLPKSTTLPNNFLENNSKSMTYLTKDHRNTIWNIKNVYLVNDRFLSLNMESMSRPYENFFYDLVTKQYINTNFIRYGNNTCGLPILENEILASDGDYFYSALSSKFMQQIFYSTVKKEIFDQNLALKKFYQTQGVLSNPVITKFNINSIN